MKWLFIFQSFLSSAPSVLLLTALPGIFGLEQTFLTISALGFCFFIIRIGIILGGLISPYLSRKLSARTICCICEILSFVILIGLSKYWQNDVILTAVLFLRFILVGVINIIRTSWIKQLCEKGWKEDVIIYVTAAPQVSYLIAGLYLFYYGVENIDYPLLIAIDAFTSLIGAFLFLALPKTDIIKKIKSKTFQIPLEGKLQWSMFYVVLLLAFAMGGANYLLVGYGETYFADYGGYELAIILYAIFFIFGARIIGALTKSAKAYDLGFKISLMVLLISLLSIQFSNQITSLFLFSSLFLSYSIILLSTNYFWMKITSTDKMASVFAFQTIAASMAWAVGEIFYPSIMLYDSWVRSIFVAFGLMASYRFFRLYRLQQSLPESKLL